MTLGFEITDSTADYNSDTCEINGNVEIEMENNRNGMEILNRVNIQAKCDGVLGGGKLTKFQL